MEMRLSQEGTHSCCRNDGTFADWKTRLAGQTIGDLVGMIREADGVGVLEGVGAGGRSSFGGPSIGGTNGDAVAVGESGAMTGEADATLEGDGVCDGEGDRRFSGFPSESGWNEDGLGVVDGGSISGVSVTGTELGATCSGIGSP